MIAIYSRIPPDTEILLTHGPSYRTLDRTRRNVHAGCPILAAKLRGLTDCRLHVCGHIHEAYGAEIRPGDRISVNAAVVEHNQPVVIDLKND
jgi:Icc-related predicted phosphoesterase